MKTFKLRPVAWLTTMATVVITLAGVQQVTDALPKSVAEWLIGAAAWATVILGWRAHEIVTPLAKPRDATGSPLVSVIPMLDPPDNTEDGPTPA